MNSERPRVDEKVLTVPSSPVLRTIQRPPAPHAPPNPVAVLRFALTVFRRWWKLIVPLSLTLSLLGAGLVYWQFAPEYQSAAWLRVHSQAPFIAFQHADDAKQFVGSLKELMRSRLLLASVASDPEVAKVREFAQAIDPIDELARRLDVTAVGSSEYFAVHIRCGDPTATATVANKVAQAYIRLQNSDERVRKEDVLTLLEGERRFHEGTVKQLRSDVERLTRATTGQPVAIPAAEKQQQNDSPLLELQRRMVTVDVESAVLRAEIESLKRQPETDEVAVSEVEIDAAIGLDPNVQRLQSEISALEELIKEYERNAAPGLDLNRSPGYQRAVSQLEVRTQELAERRTKLREQSMHKSRSTEAARRRDALGVKQTALQSYEMVRSVLQDQFQKELKRVKEQSGDSLELEFKRAELDQATQVFNLVSQRMLQLRTEMRAPDRVVMVESAPVPSLPLESLPLKKMLAAAVALLIAPFGLAMGWERWMDRVGESIHLEQESQLRVVGEVVSYPRIRRKHRAPAAHRRDSINVLYEECVDNLCTSMLLAEPTCRAQVVAFTSAISHEGKTSLAVQFAASVARATRMPVLLVDGDMRCPDIHKIFGVPVSPGLVDVLGGATAFADSVVTNCHDLIHVLPSGKLHESPHELLGEHAFADFLTEARKQYRFIVIDTPPVLAAGEALILAKEADATLICTMRDLSRMPQVRAAHQRLVDAGARPSGAVLSGVSPSSYRFRYGGYDYKD